MESCNSKETQLISVFCIPPEMLQYNGINKNKDSQITRKQEWLDCSLNFCNFQGGLWHVSSSHTALCKLKVDCREGDFGDDYGQVLGGRQPRPHNAPAGEKILRIANWLKDHLSDKTAVIVGHSVGDDLSSAVRQLDCVGALGGEISWGGGIMTTLDVHLGVCRLTQVPFIQYQQQQGYIHLQLVNLSWVATKFFSITISISVSISISISTSSTAG